MLLYGRIWMAHVDQQPQKKYRAELDVAAAWQLVREMGLKAAETGAIFKSARKHKQYRILQASDTRLTIARVDGGQNESLKKNEIERAIRKLNDAGGMIARKSLIVPVAKEAALVYLHPQLEWSENGEQIRGFADSTPAANESLLPNAWIFQGNPDRFDLDAYINDFRIINWAVTETTIAKQIQPGDEVFIWRSAGSKRNKAGIVARARILDFPRERPEDKEALPYYKKGERATIGLRVKLQIFKRLLNETDFISKEQVSADPVLSTLKILRIPRRTNFRLTIEQGARLWKLCELIRPTYGDFGQAPNDDPTNIQNFARKVRRGQPKFRGCLLKLYDGKCAVSGWAPAVVLQAAHILDHAEAGINHTDNGILLRSDLHDLFDEGLLRIEPATCKVVIHPTLRGTPYWEFHGRSLRPRRDGSQPAHRYLLRRWKMTPR